MDSESERDRVLSDFPSPAPPFTLSPTYGADVATYGSLFHQQFEPHNDPSPQAFVSNMVSAFDAADFSAFINENDTIDPSLQPAPPALEPVAFQKADGEKRGQGSPRKQLATRKAAEVTLAQTGDMNYFDAMEDFDQEDIKDEWVAKKRGPGRPPKAKPAPISRVADDFDISIAGDENGIPGTPLKKRGRGRPPTRESEAVGETEIPDADAESLVAEPPLKKRGRGRPPKVHTAAAEDETSDQKEVGTRKRSRGLVSEAMLGQDEEAEDREPPKKRPRGRPRKSLPTPRDDDEAAGIESHEEEDDGVDVVEGPTRRQSRRKMHFDVSSDERAQQPVEDDKKPQVDEPPKKRGPGRPRKSVPGTPATPALKTAIPASEVNTPYTATKRRPGRPPKKRRGRKPQTPASNNAQELDSDMDEAPALVGGDEDAADDRVIVALPVGQDFEDFVNTNPTWRKAGLVALGQVHEGGMGNIRSVIERLNRDRGDAI
ncbi:hypothetical protein BDV96DRAFT_567262 [Lophiotrema nucula]|uniref:Uncharacterized protein n=1 Tax=Lophiotrema nucula TaxID=690887 RepID=A0A6A5ZIH9_9PLEO|nr:hypothetical protein BDV96DRAFT_567262 [Lophiotrema nucula]